MNFSAVVLALVFGSAAAFVPSTRMARTTVSMKAEEQGRREFGAAAAAALAGAGFAQGASASAGAGAKFSVFGLTKGQATMYSEGAAYGTDQSGSTFSPYSTQTDKSLYSTVDNSAFYKKICAESEKRFGNYPDYISKKSWLDIKTENTRYLYNLRKAMNGLATTKDQKAAAKKVFVDLEDLTYAATIKSPDAATAAYNAVLSDFAAYKKAVGI